MSGEVGAVERVTITQLINALARFATGSSHDRDVELRWLAKQAEAFQELAVTIVNERPTADTKRAIAQYRLAEIATAQDALLRQGAELDREAQRVRAASEQP